MEYQDTANQSLSELDQSEFDLSFFSRIRMMFSAFWTSRVRMKVILLSAALLTIILATAYAQILLNRWNVPFYDSLERRDINEFFHQLVVFSGIASFLLLLNVAQTWFNQMLALYMREGLTRDLVDHWLKEKRALRLTASGAIGVNPDQRLHEDARNLSESTTGLTIGLVQATVLLASFIGVLWHLSEGFVFHLGGNSFSIPGYMVWAAVLYAGIASLLSQLVGGRLVRLNADRYSKEAELRFSLMRTNENLSAITLAGGEENERRHINVDISRVLAVLRSIAIAQTNLTWVTAGTGWLAVIVPILVAAPVYFAGSLTFGGLMMAVGAFNQVYAALRWYVANFSAIADWKATLIRVTNFRHALLYSNGKAHEHAKIEVMTAPPGVMTLSDVEISTHVNPTASNGGFRLHETDVRIGPGERIMINGDYGVNRRLLFAAFARLWPWGKGKMALPPGTDMLFMAQTIYLPEGTLREVIAYPEDKDAFSSTEISAVLERVGLGRLTSMLDNQARWDRLLDTDDKRCLAFANMLLRKPRWLVLDDVLEGLEPDCQQHLSEVLRELPDTTIIYVGRSEAYVRVVNPRVLHLERLRTGGSAKEPVPAE
ncbi:ABC transporter ATP-binding protein/permease [Rhizobiaceae bacterium n13]|uniref:ABC transporter ATP-binding protein/permease n=1 Tax=Ferirhizobium litorale TaxID=2927786 RepID=A0AAE3QDD9_9HYPH|nr:ABC transporter ATP-binding protein/permease [Fererhizobium litorale]MDI7864879.1 ABC transporter ATP-binding protein/permease [Fererhizobium litorale]MDI7923110.1 ABC transporter ATP-binding protein/permease [Fererhizobium litorale]